MMINLKQVRLAATVGALVATTAAWSDTYDFELYGGVSSTRFDSENIENIESYGAGGTVYLKGVNTDGMPLGEAAFLNKASNAYVDYSYAENSGYDTRITDVGGEFFLPGSVLYAGVNYRMEEQKYSDEERFFSGDLGVAVDGLLITTHFVEDVDYDPNVYAKYVMMTGRGSALNVYGRWRSEEQSDFYTVGMDYYFTSHTSMGFEYADALDFPTDAFEEFTVRAKHFFDNSLYVAGYYTNAEFSDNYGVELGFRF